MRLQRLLVGLYPRRWRSRYGREMDEMLAAQPLTMRSAVDLLAGAIDARLNPQVLPAPRAAAGGEMTMTTRMFRCGAHGLSRADSWRSAAWMVGGSLVLVGVGLALQVAIGRSALSDGLLYAAFPAALMLSNECTYFKPYSRAARLTLSGGGALLIVLLMWGSVALGNRL